MERLQFYYSVWCGRRLADVATIRPGILNADVPRAAAKTLTLKSFIGYAREACNQPMLVCDLQQESVVLTDR